MAWILWWIVSHWLFHVLLAYVIGSLSTLAFLYLALQGKLGSRLERYEKQFDALRTITEHAMDRGSRAWKRKTSKFAASSPQVIGQWKMTDDGEEWVDEEIIPPVKVSIEPIESKNIDRAGHSVSEPVRRAHTTDNVTHSHRVKDVENATESPIAVQSENCGRPVHRETHAVSSPVDIRRAATTAERQRECSVDGTDRDRMARRDINGRTFRSVAAVERKPERGNKPSEERESRRRTMYGRSVALVARRRRNGHKRTTSASSPITPSDFALADASTCAQTLIASEVTPKSLVRSPSSPALTDLRIGDSAVSQRALSYSVDSKRPDPSRHQRKKDAKSEEKSTDSMDNLSEKEKHKRIAKEEREREKERERLAKELEKERIRTEKEREKAEKEREKEERKREREIEKEQRREQKHAKKSKSVTPTERDEETVEDTDILTRTDTCESLAHSQCEEDRNDSVTDDKRETITRERSKSSKKKSKKGKRSKSEWTKCDVSDWCPELVNSSDVLAEGEIESNKHTTKLTTTEQEETVVSTIESEVRKSDECRVSSVRATIGKDIDRYLQQRFLEAPLIHCGWMKIKTSLRRYRYRWFAVKAGVVAVYTRPFFDTGLLNATAIMLLTPDCSVCYKISGGGEFRLSVRSPNEKMFASRGFTGARLIGYETSMISKKKKHCKLALQSLEKGKTWASALVKAIQSSEEMEDVVTYLRSRRAGTVASYEEEKIAHTEYLSSCPSTSAMSDVSFDTHASDSTKPVKARMPKGLMSQVMMSGWLKLETAATKGKEIEWIWIKRWCIVYKGIVVVFTSPDAKECSAMINLWNCSIRAAPELTPTRAPEPSSAVGSSGDDNDSDAYLSLDSECDESSEEDCEYVTDEESDNDFDKSFSDGTARGRASEKEPDRDEKKRKKRRMTLVKGLPKKFKRKKSSKKRKETESVSPKSDSNENTDETTRTLPKHSPKKKEALKDTDRESEETVERSRVFELISTSQQSGDVGQLIKKLPDFNRAAQYQIHEALLRFHSQSGGESKSLSELVDEADPVPTKDKFSKFTKKSSDAAPLGQQVSIDGDRDQRLLRFMAPSVSDAKRWLDALSAAAGVNYWEFPLEFVRITSKAREAKKESADWLNNFLDRYFAEMVNSKAINDKMFNWIQRKLDQLKKPDILGPIVVRDVDLGSSLLRTTGISLEAHQNGKELIGECDVVYQGGASVHLFTEVYLNWPTRQFISVPVEATVTMSYASGKLGLYVPPLLMGRATVTFLELPNTVFNTNVDIGGSKRYNVASLFPQITEFLQTSMQKLVWKTLVMPNRMTFALGIPENSASLRLDRVASRPKGQASGDSPPTTQ